MLNIYGIEQEICSISHVDHFFVATLLLIDLVQASLQVVLVLDRSAICLQQDRWKTWRLHEAVWVRTSRRNYGLDLAV